MKKIFAISFLSLMAVTGGARAEVEQYNLNLATAQYVDDVRDDLYDRIVDKYEVVNSQGQNWAGWNIESRVENNPDDYIPTVAHMDAAIEDAVDGVDTSGLVDKAQVIKSDDKALSDGATDLSSANADQIVPTVGMVQENFVPNLPSVTYNQGTEITVRSAADLQPGSYSLVVDVWGDQAVSYRWVAMSTGNAGGAQIGCETTAGNICPK